MKKVLLTIAVIFSAVTISLACGEEKKACCKKGEKKACAKDEKSCSKAKSCCKKKAASAEAVAPAVEPAKVTPAK